MPEDFQVLGFIPQKLLATPLAFPKVRRRDAARGSRANLLTMAAFQPICTEIIFQIGVSRE
ncbi:MAG: hypothetical protein V7L07_13280 [Nostoc sp.]